MFPTVILEAMASARPVISTRLAGIPELVVAGETGILVSPSDTSALTKALEQLLRDPDLRLRYGSAARLRIEQHFQIENTVAPLIEMFESCSRRPAGDANVSGWSLLAGTKSSHCPDRASRGEAATNIAYLIDRWPDHELPLLERELKEMKRRNVPIVPFVCELNPSVRLNRDMQEIATSLEFLPDAMVLEAEWRANRALEQKFEESRAQQSSRAPDTIFLRQARFALVLRKLLQERNVAHVHATSSRALVSALILKKLLDVTVSATIEARSELSRNWVQNALAECVGGRLSNRKLVEQYCRASVSDATSEQSRRFTETSRREPSKMDGRVEGPSERERVSQTPYKRTFLLDKTTFRSAPRKALGLVAKKTGIDLTTGTRFWQQWAELLSRWSCTDRKSKIENRK